MTTPLNIEQHHCRASFHLMTTPMNIEQHHCRASSTGNTFWKICSDHNSPELSITTTIGFHFGSPLYSKPTSPLTGAPLIVKQDYSQTVTLIKMLRNQKSNSQSLLPQIRQYHVTPHCHSSYPLSVTAPTGHEMWHNITHTECCLQYVWNIHMRPYTIG